MQKKAVIMQDFSCFGKCSLTVALPVVSAFGIAVSPIPTSLLSSHTGGLGNNTYLDLTDEVCKILEHWETLELRFDALYTGYFASRGQVLAASRLFESFGKGAIKLTDPAMADNGKLYRALPEDMPALFSLLCGKSDIITPNLTEARFLLDLPYKPDRSKKTSRELCDRLMQKFGASVVLTGAGESAAETGCAVMTRDGEFYMVSCEMIEGRYHGTGDLFTSVLLALILCGCALSEAAEFAVGFVADVIRETKNAGESSVVGLAFEGLLCDFADKIKNS